MADERLGGFAQGFAQTFQPVQALQMRQAKLAAGLKAQQALFNQAKTRLNEGIKMLGDPHVPNTSKTQIFNNLDNYATIALPGVQFGQVEKWEDPFNKVSTNFSKFWNDPQYTIEQKKSLIPAFRQEARETLGPTELQTFEQQVLTPSIESRFGAGPVQQFPTPGRPGEITSTKVSPTGEAVPITFRGKDISQIDPKIRTFITQRGDKFNTSEVTKEDLKVMSKLNTIRELAINNPSGALGTVKKMVARLTDVGRLSDFDVEFTDIDQSLKQEFLAFIAKKGKGKLSPLAVKNIDKLVDIMEGAMRRNLQASLASAVTAISPFTKGLPEDQVRRMIAGPSFSQIMGTVKRDQPSKALDIDSMNKQELLQLLPAQLNALSTDQLQLFLEKTK